MRSFIRSIIVAFVVLCFSPGIASASCSKIPPLNASGETRTEGHKSSRCTADHEESTSVPQDWSTWSIQWDGESLTLRYQFGGMVDYTGSRVGAADSEEHTLRYSIDDCEESRGGINLIPGSGSKDGERLDNPQPVYVRLNDDGGVLSLSAPASYEPGAHGAEVMALESSDTRDGCNEYVTKVRNVRGGGAVARTEDDANDDMDDDDESSDESDDSTVAEVRATPAPTPTPDPYDYDSPVEYPDTTAAGPCGNWGSWHWQISDREFNLSYRFRYERVQVDVVRCVAVEAQWKIDSFTNRKLDVDFQSVLSGISLSDRKYLAIPDRVACHDVEPLEGDHPCFDRSGFSFIVRETKDGALGDDLLGAAAYDVRDVSGRTARPVVAQRSSGSPQSQATPAPQPAATPVAGQPPISAPTPPQPCASPAECARQYDAGCAGNDVEACRKLAELYLAASQGALARHDEGLRILRALCSRGDDAACARFRTASAAASAAGEPLAAIAGPAPGPDAPIIGPPSTASAGHPAGAEPGRRAYRPSPALEASIGVGNFGASGDGSSAVTVLGLAGGIQTRNPKVALLATGFLARDHELEFGGVRFDGRLSGRWVYGQAGVGFGIAKGQAGPVVGMRVGVFRPVGLYVGFTGGLFDPQPGMVSLGVQFSR